MKTKTEKKVAAPAIVAGEGYKQLFSGEYKTSEISIVSNFRKTFNEKALKELAENIAKVGVLQPVILRRAEGNKYPVLVAGERRYRAAMLAGLKTIPGRILDLTEDQALEVQALENLHRKDLSPIEEARAFKVLLDQKGHSVEQAEDLANRVGKTSSYVYRALRLLELPDNALDKIEAGTWTPAHGHQLLRLTRDAERERMMAWLEEGDGYDEFTVPSALSLKDKIEGSSKDLGEAIFPTTVEYAKDIACNTCAENSSNQTSLFDNAEKGQCLNPDCFERKSAHARKEQVSKALEQMPEGVRNLGTKTSNSYGNIQGLKGAKVIKEISKDVRKVMEANPKAFAMAVIHERWGNQKNEPILICTDTTVLGEKAQKSEERQDYNREHFINSAVRIALMKGAKDLAPKKLTMDHLVMILKGMEEASYSLGEYLHNIFDLKDNGSWEKHVTKLKEPEILGTILAAAAYMKGEGNDDKAFKDLGVDVKSITKTVKAEAAKEYDAKKAAEAKSKKGAKSETTEEPEDGDDE